MSIKSWLQDISKIFQPAYDSIREWSLTPQQKELMDKYWEDLSPALKKAMWAFLAYILSKYGVETAASQFEAIIKKLESQGIAIRIS